MFSGGHANRGGRGSRGGGYRGRGGGGGGGGGGGQWGRGRGGSRGRGRGGHVYNGGGEAGSIGNIVLWRFEGSILPVGPFSIDAKAIFEIRNKVMATCKAAKEVIPICQERARFFYMLKAKGFPFAMRNSLKQQEWVRSGKGFNCGICDVYFDAHMELLRHNELVCHKEILALFKSFDRITREWFKVMTDPTYEITDTTRNAERNGLVIDPSKESTASVTTTPLNDKLFEELDVDTLDEEEFVLAAYDNIMEVHWPKPITDFYCRECNYSSFVTQEQLDIHKSSDQHKTFETNYSTSWCVSCQFHTGSRKNLETHNQGARHLMIVKVLEDVRVMALEYWKKKRFTVNQKLVDKKPSIARPLMSSNAPPMMSPNASLMNNYSNGPYYGNQPAPLMGYSNYPTNNYYTQNTSSLDSRAYQPGDKRSAYEEMGNFKKRFTSF